MGYTPFARLNIREYPGRKNPVASITIPFNLVKELKWKEGNIIAFQKYKSDLTSSINLINFNKSSRKYIQPMLWEYPEVIENLRKNRLRIFHAFPKRKTRDIMEEWYYNKKYKRSDKTKIKRLNKKEIDIEEKIKEQQLKFLNAEKLTITSEILNMENRLPYLRLRLNEIKDQIKQIISS